MARGIAFLMILTSVLPSDGSAQSVPSPGDRIRISEVDGIHLRSRPNGGGPLSTSNAVYGPFTTSLPRRLSA